MNTDVICVIIGLITTCLSNVDSHTHTYALAHTHTIARVYTHIVCVHIGITQG